MASAEMIVPTVAEVRAWTNVTAQSLSDDQVNLIITAEAMLQAAFCAWGADVYPAALSQALLRRTARTIAARQLPLGLTSDQGSESQPVRLPLLDVEIERLEAPWRVIPIA
jgi:hypothetical protein